MNRYKKHILQVTIVALMLNSAMPAQAIDWNYWSNCAREKIGEFVASMPSKNRVIDRLKQPKVWGALAVVSVVAAVGLYYMKNKQQPKQLSLEEIAKQAQILLSNRYALNRAESIWNIGGAVIWKVSESDYSNLKEQYKGVALIDMLDDQYERICLSNDENLTPEALKENKAYIKLFRRLENINLEQLNTYISELSIYIKASFDDHNFPKQLQDRLEQKFEQMKAFRDIVQEVQQGR